MSRRPPSSRLITGVAVASSVWSTAARNIGTITATNRRRKRARSKVGAGSAGAAAIDRAARPGATGRPSRTRQARPVEPKPPPPRALASNDVDDAELGLHHRHDHQLRDALERLIVNARSPRFQQLTISGPW